MDPDLGALHMVCPNFMAAMVLAVFVEPTDEAVKKETTRFGGSWRIVSSEIEGSSAPQDQLKGSRLTFDGKRFMSTEEGRTSGGTFRVDPSRHPRTIDLIFTEGPEKNKTVLGIYELDGDLCRLCLAPPGQDRRPSQFAGKRGSGHVYSVLKRVRAN
jgi:uncharacterized protein (TIGR03067 family)